MKHPGFSEVLMRYQLGLSEHFPLDCLLPLIWSDLSHPMSQFHGALLGLKIIFFPDNAYLP